MKNEDKKDYILVKKTWWFLQVFALGLTILGGIVYAVRKDGLTFDTQSEKQDVMNHINPSDQSIKIHLSRQDRERLVRIEVIQSDVLKELIKINEKLDNQN